MTETLVSSEASTSREKLLFWVGKVVGGKTPWQIRKSLMGIVFLSPWLAGLLIFWLGPIMASLYFSFTKYDIISPPRFLGLANYQRAFLEDELFVPSLWRTLKYALIMVPVGQIGSLILAILLNRDSEAVNAYRTFFFLPSLTPIVAMAILWKWLLHPNIGPINTALGFIGIDGPGWLTSQTWALPSLILMGLWAGWGGNTMLIYLAGLQNVPDSLIDAAEIDGAGTWAKFRNVTLPMISPTILFNLILGVIGALQVFAAAFVATEGGPSYATWFLALHIYNQAFKYFRLGYGSALAWVFVLILLVFTFVQLRMSERWVYYTGGE